MKRTCKFVIFSFFFATMPLYSAAFMKLGDIKGEAKDSAHKEWIDVLSISNLEAGPQSDGSCSYGSRDNEVVITKYIDKSSPLLARSLCAVDSFFDIVVIHSHGKNKKGEYIKIQLEEVHITSVSTGGSGGEDRPTEDVSLNFANVKFEYVEEAHEKRSKEDEID